jgi:hypothetical protein
MLFHGKQNNSKQPRRVAKKKNLQQPSQLSGFKAYSYGHMAAGKQYCEKVFLPYNIYELEMETHTKDKEVKAFVWQVFINQYVLLSLRTTSQEFDQVCVLEFCYELYLIFELYETLS